MNKNCILFSILLFALSPMPQAIAKKSDDGAPPVSLVTVNRQANETLAPSPEHAGHRAEQKLPQKKNKRELFMEKHRRYNSTSEITERNRQRKSNQPKSRYEDFQEKRERYSVPKEQYNIDSSVEDVKALINELERKPAAVNIDTETAEQDGP